MGRAGAFRSAAQTSKLIHAGESNLWRTEQQVEAPVAGSAVADAHVCGTEERIRAEEPGPDQSVPGDGELSNRLVIRPTSADPPT